MSGPAALMRDWLTICQSELSATATNPELLQAWTRLLDIWVAGAATATRFLAPSPPAAARHDPAPGHPGPEPPAGSKAADVAPATGDAALERLARRVDELERRLAGLDGNGPASGRD